MSKINLFRLSIPSLKKESYNIRLRGQKSKNMLSLYEEVARIFRFPTYFSYNIDSFYTCLNELDELKPYPEYNVIIEDYDVLLSERDRLELKDFLEILKETSDNWENIPNEPGEDEWRHKANFNIYIQYSPKSLNDMKEFGIAYNVL